MVFVICIRDVFTYPHAYVSNLFYNHEKCQLIFINSSIAPERATCKAINKF